MPNIKSAKKRVKITKVKSSNNQMAKSALKTSLKKFDQALKGSDSAATNELHKAAVVSVDKAVSKGILHKNTAARKKSQMALKINKA